MESIRKQFALDWLPGGDEPTKKTPSRLTKRSLDEARDYMYSSVIGNHLLKASNHELPLFDLARSVREDVREFSFEEFWEAIKGIADRGVIEVDNLSEESGNYTIRLTRS